MTRLSFLKIMAGLFSLLPAIKFLLPRVVMFAARPKHYPGNIREISHHETERTGKWLG